MIYFPPQKKEQNLNFIENLGTNFFKINENFDKKLDSWKSKYLNAEDANIFYKNYNKFYHSKFEENKLIGFIKNNKSWHDVTMFKENFLRRLCGVEIIHKFISFKAKIFSENFFIFSALNVLNSKLLISGS